MYCRDEDDRKDLLQEMVIQLWKAYPMFRGESKFSTWLYQISLNVAISQVRKESRKPQKEGINEVILNISGENEHDENEEKRRLLYNAIAQLTEVEKALTMLYLEEYSNEEIAEITGITQNNVRVKMHRFQEKLRKILTK